MLGMQLFNKAGATGHVFLMKGGKLRNRGLAYGGFVGPLTTVAVVPTVAQILDFEIEDLHTQDNQTVGVSGSITIEFDPATAVRHFDFTVNPRDGSYKSPWDRTLRTMVIKQVLDPVREAVSGLEVEDAINAHVQIAEALKAALTAQSNELAQKGVRSDSDSFSIKGIAPTDEDLNEAIGAEEREQLLTAADDATHGRQMNSAKNARAVKEYEVQTQLEVEKGRGMLIEEQGKNAIALAEKDAQATTIRLAPLSTVDPGKLLGAAIMDLAKTGKLGNLAITSEFLAAINQK